MGNSISCGNTDWRSIPGTEMSSIVLESDSNHTINTSWCDSEEHSVFAGSFRVQFCEFRTELLYDFSVYNRDLLSWSSLWSRWERQELWLSQKKNGRHFCRIEKGGERPGTVINKTELQGLPAQEHCESRSQKKRKKKLKIGPGNRNVVSFIVVFCTENHMHIISLRLRCYP